PSGWPVCRAVVYGCESTVVKGVIMFLGHFALAAATKPAAPEVPAWALMAASQAMDIAFIPLVAAGVESITMAGYGQATIHAYYTHSIVGTVIIAGLVFAI